MALTDTAVLDALKAVRDPDLNRDIVSLKFIKNLRIDGGAVAFSIELTTPACPVKDQMRDQARALVSALPGVTSVARFGPVVASATRRSFDFNGNSRFCLTV